MKNVDDTFEFDGINGPEPVTVEVDMTSKTPAPLNPFSGFASGCFPPFWAILMAKPMTRLTVGGKTNRSSSPTDKFQRRVGVAHVGLI